MLTIEVETAVGHHGFGNVYLVYGERFGNKEYWDYFYTKVEADDLVSENLWATLQVQEMSYSTFEIIKDKIQFYHRRWFLLQ